MQSLYPLFLVLFMQSFTLISDGDISALRSNLMDTYKKCEGERYLESQTYSLEINENGFLRYRRSFKNHKTEFFSVKLDRVKDINFYGHNQGGWLLFSCEPETVIYQTHNDPKGNIDSMANEISFPVATISEDELNSFVSDFNSLKDLLLKK